MTNTSSQRYTVALFVLNGLIATAVQYLCLKGLIEVAHVPSAGLANGIASVFGITASYVGNSVMVFRSRRAIGRTLPLFLLLYSALACLNAAVLWIWSDLGGLDYTVGFVLATALATGLSYLGNRFIVFAERSPTARGNRAASRGSASP